MKLLWLTLNCSYSHSSLALPILQLATQQNAPELAQHLTWDALEALTQDNPFTIAANAAARQPDVIAAPLYIFNRNAVLETLARIKTLLPSVRIIAGGPECLGEGARQLLLQAPFIDIAISGEGEAPLPRALKALLEHTMPPNDDNIQCQHAPDHTPAPAVFTDWTDALPPATSPFFTTDKPFVQLETARGCPFACQYCTSAKTTLRYKSISQTSEEISLLQQKGIREIRLLDRTFNVPDSRAVQLLQLFRTVFPNIRFHLEIHPQFLTPVIKEELKRANPGQLHIEAGIQSLHNHVLQAVGRLPNAEQTLEGLHFLVNCHPRFDTHCDLLAGLPLQTLDGLVQDLKRLIAIHPAEIQLEILKILPGTLLKARADELGIRFSPMTPYDVMQTPHMTVHDIATARNLSRLVDLFYNHPALTDTVHAANAAKATFIDDLLAHLEHKTTMLASQTPSLDARMLLLNDVFKGEIWAEEPMFQLACAWMRQANTPEKPGFPAQTATRLETLPANAIPCRGDTTAALRDTRTRLFLLPHPTHPAIFAYNRAIAPNRAAAEWYL